MKKYKRITFIVGMVVLLSFGNAFANFDNPETLRGLEGVEIVVERLHPEIEQDGLLQSTLQTDVELKLRMAGIKVLSKEDCLKMIDLPYLYLNVHAMKLTNGSYVYNIMFVLREMVFLIRGGIDVKERVSLIEGSIEVRERVFLIGDGERRATTFKVARLGITPNLSDIRDEAKNVVDEFINAWLSVNSK